MKNFLYNKGTKGKGGIKMTKDYFKRLTVIEYTSWDLNCRNVVRHTPIRNKFEKTIKRRARRKDKLFLKKFLTA